MSFTRGSPGTTLLTVFLVLGVLVRMVVGLPDALADFLGEFG